MASICELNCKKADIKYPTCWEYKVIFDVNDAIDDKILEIVGNREHKKNFSKFSKNKKYASYDISVLVFGDEERLEIFSAFKHCAKYVL
ncbi:MAG: DUF493 domain-containing protein [Campylobacter sp.]|nr:DUF493 domain-containing protein [Campylobacter sp.]